MFVCGTQDWRVELPPDWCAQNCRGNVAIYDPNGVGALQISSIRKQHEVTEADLRETAGGFPANADELRPIQVGEFVGLWCESQEAESYWVRWLIARGSVMLFITYNCAASERGRERDMLTRVLTSLKCPTN